MADGLDGIIGHQIVLYFNDGTNIQRREGLFLEIKDAILVLKTSVKIEGIPVHQLVRFEERQ